MAENPIPSIRNPLSPMHERDVAPRLHLRRDEGVGLLVVLSEKLKGPLGEHDAESPGHVARVLLEEAHFGVGMAPLPEGREVEPGRARRPGLRCA